MSSTLVYQESSHTRSKFHDSSSLNIKLNNPSKLTFSSSSSSISRYSSNNNNSNDAKCTWSDIEAFSINRKHEGDQQEYVHPSWKRPSMSNKSLEMCTESLCSETGVFFTADSLIFSTTTTTTTTPATITNSNNNSSMNKKPNFPPPLTTMRGLESVQLRPYREKGRLVIEVVSPSLSRGSYLKAERSDGRLTMSMVIIEQEIEQENVDETSRVTMEEGNLENNQNIEKEEIEVVKLIEEDYNYQIRYNFRKIWRDFDITVLFIRILLPRGIEENKVKVEFGGKMGKGENNYELSERGIMGNLNSCGYKDGSGVMNIRTWVLGAFPFLISLIK